MGDARETEKAPDAFRTISEVADDLELPQHVLRFWETRFPQIRPVKRAGGRRFYRPEDVDLLRGIRHLLYTDGFTIKGAQRVLKDQGVRYVQDLGIEREVAVMRSARPARGEEGEGVTFGGLLGLLPRRRPKGRTDGRAGDDADLPELPQAAELPLPFPDPEADRDLAQEPDVPPIALRAPPPATRGRPGPGERRDPVFEPAPDRRREPRFESPRFQDPGFEAPGRESQSAQDPRLEAPAPQGRAPEPPALDTPAFDTPPFDSTRRRDHRAAEVRSRAPRLDDLSGRDDAAEEPPHDPRFREPRPHEPRPRETRPHDLPDPRWLEDAGPDAADEAVAGADDDLPGADPSGTDPRAAPPRGPRIAEPRHRGPDPAAPYPAAPQLRAPGPDDGPPRPARGRASLEDEPGFALDPAERPQPPAQRRPEEPRPARRERLEPVLPPRRPTRGPASRLESLGSRPGEGPPPGGHGALDDPLLPFFEDMPGAAPSVSEPIEARIQRLRAQERRPARPYEEGQEGTGAAPHPPEAPSGPPEEFIPPRARRASAPPHPAATHPPEAAVPPPRRREAGERLIQDGEWRQTDWVEATREETDWEETDWEETGRHPARQSSTRDDAARNDPTRQDPTWQDPTRQDPTRQDPARQDPARQDPARQDPTWQDPTWQDASWENDPFAPPPSRAPHPPRPAPRAGAASPYAPPHGPAAAEPPLAADDDPESDMTEQERRRPPVALPQDEWREPAAGARAAAVPARRPAGKAGEAYAPDGYARPPHAPYPAEPPPAYPSGPQPAARPRAFTAPGQAGPAGAGPAAEPDARRVWDEGWGENAPQALPRATRVGPLIGPILEEEPTAPHDVMPEDEQRRMADRMAGRPVAEPPGQRRAPPWVHADAPAEMGPTPRGEAPYVAEPAAQRLQREPMPREPMPREPLRGGPPEQYLPPHLRTEPRVSGHPPMAAPVLSRDDVHRMQSALYELGECRRLMEGVLSGKDARPAD